MPKRTDANQTEIVKAFRRIGALVAVTSPLGSGFPDLVVGRPGGGLKLVELKDGSKPPSARRLTDDEKRFHALWGEHVVIVESLEDAIALVQTLSRV
jgi:hypothetical protein